MGAAQRGLLRQHPQLPSAWSGATSAGWPPAELLKCGPYHYGTEFFLQCELHVSSHPRLMATAVDNSSDPGNHREQVIRATYLHAYLTVNFSLFAQWLNTRVSRHSCPVGIRSCANTVHEIKFKNEATRLLISITL